MKLVTFTHAGATRIGKVLDQQIIDLSSACPTLPTDMVGLLRAGAPALEQARRAEPGARATIALKDVHLEPPVLNPSKYLAIGMNYKDHAEEAIRKGVKIPDTQVWFNKQVSCLNGPFDPIHMPRVSDKLDYEVELGVVIGTRCRHVAVHDAHKVIGGYLAANDVSVRDWQTRAFTWTLGKSFDTHGPIGPWLVTADEIPDPHALDMKLWVNGELRQHASTRLMIHDIFHQIAHLSTVMTLQPGDLLATGTPAGVGFGMEPPRFLRVGDVVRIEIERVGAIENTVVAEPA